MKLSLAAALCLLPMATQAQIRISEFVASNTQSHPDLVDFSDYPDWIGRLGGVIAKPRPDKGVYSCVFAGPGNAYLYVCGGDAVHRRKTLTQAP